MLSALPLPSPLSVLSSAVLSSVAVAHRQPRWASPRAPLLLPMTTMPSVLLSLRPQPRTKTHTSARWWHSKARASAHSQTMPANLLQPPRCCHRAAHFALPPPPLTLPPPPRRRQASANVAMARCCHQRRCAVALPPTLQTLPLLPLMPPCCR